MPDESDLHIYGDGPQHPRMWRCPTCGQRVETADLRPTCPADGAPLGRVPR